MVALNWYLLQRWPSAWPLLLGRFIPQAEEGLFSPADLIRTEGMKNWTRADQVEGLFAASTCPVVPSPAFLLSHVSNWRL